MNPWQAMIVAAVASIFACAPPPPPAEIASIGGDAVARVGEARIPTALVGGVAATRGVSARDALAFLVDDALAAEAARARGLETTPAASWAFTAARARFAATRVREDARSAGVPSDDEIEQLTAFHWLEYDLPEQVRVVHALAMRPKGSSPDALARARTVAIALSTAVAGAVTAEDFEDRAKAVPHADVEVVVQPLPPFVADGRIAAPGNGTIEPQFAAAAFALTVPGATSGVVETPFGWHIVQLVERLPAKSVPLAERRARLTEEVYAARARGIRDDLLQRLRASYRVQVSPAAESTMAIVSVVAP